MLRVFFLRQRNPCQRIQVALQGVFLTQQLFRINIGGNDSVQRIRRSDRRDLIDPRHQKQTRKRNPLIHGKKTADHENFLSFRRNNSDRLQLLPGRCPCTTEVSQRQYLELFPRGIWKFLMEHSAAGIQVQFQHPRLLRKEMKHQILRVFLPCRNLAGFTGQGTAGDLPAVRRAVNSAGKAPQVKDSQNHSRPAHFHKRHSLFKIKSYHFIPFLFIIRIFQESSIGKTKKRKNFSNNPFIL